MSNASQISYLKSPNPMERKAAAADLASHVDGTAIRPLFEALMNWDEEEEAIRLISMALFINLWVMIPKKHADLLTQALSAEMSAGGQRGLFYSGVRGAIEGLLISHVLGGERPKPGQSERIGFLVRSALAEQKVRNFVLYGEKTLNLSNEVKEKGNRSAAHRWWQFWK